MRQENKEVRPKRKKNIVQTLQNAIIAAGFLLLLVASFGLFWIRANYSNIGFDEIMFHLHTPLQGTADAYISSFIRNVIVPAIGTVVEVGVGISLIRIFLFKGKTVGTWCTGGKWLYIRKHFRFFITCIMLCWACILLWRADKNYGVFEYIHNRMSQSSFIEEQYVDPKNVEVSFPEKRRNLIFIMLESGETSTQDEKNGGLMAVNYTPEMTALEEQNISFSQSELFVGAEVAPQCSWTIAGMVAETAGIPLKAYYSSNNEMGQMGAFLPTVVTLGDILAKEKYQNVIMAGSDFAFAGRNSYFRTHGNYEILDYKTAIKRKVIPEDYYVWWGLEDRILYQWAKDELIKLADKDAPFNFSLLTVDTHAANGYVCELCEDTYDARYANVWKCASKQLHDFISWIQEQEFYKNTTVVVMGDHCSMDPGFYPKTTGSSEILIVEEDEEDNGLEELGNTKQPESERDSVAGVDTSVKGMDSESFYTGANIRGVYNVFINVPQVIAEKGISRQKNRKFTTLDFFPTILSSIGAEINGNRLGLGVDLFSNDDTLSEKYGYEYLFSELNKHSVFYEEKMLLAE